MTITRKPVRQRRLLAIERRLTAIEAAFQIDVASAWEEVAKLRIQNALLAGTTNRLIGENDRLRLNLRKAGGSVL